MVGAAAAFVLGGVLRRVGQPAGAGTFLVAGFVLIGVWSGLSSVEREAEILGFVAQPRPVDATLRMLTDPRSGDFGWWALARFDPPRPPRPPSVPVLLSFADEPAGADEALVKALGAFLAEADEDKRAAAGFALAMQHADAAVVAKALPKARTWPADAEKGDVVIWKRSTADGKEHSIFAAIPEAYDAKKVWPVLIWLHGAVARPVDGGGASGVRALAELADQEGFIVLSPSAQTGSEWWLPTGVDLVRGSLDDLKQRYRVDANRVAVAGFSDGASGCLHLLAHDPEPYCCFLPLRSHPGVTRLAGGPSFAVNVQSRPVFAVNGGRDTLYPSAQIKPLIDQLKAAGCDLTWLDLPEAGHRLTDVFPDHWDKVRDFWKAHPRVPLAKTIAWETSMPQRQGRFGWVEIVSVDPQAPSAKGAKAAVLPDPAGRPVLGVRIVRTYPGPGVQLEQVEEGSAADEAGFLVDDIILAIDGVELKDPRQAMGVLQMALPAMAAAKKAGTFKVRRGDQELELKCLPKAAGSGRIPRPKELGYDLPSGRIEARVEGNVIHVSTRHVASFRLHLADGLVDLAKPVQVLVNGETKFEGPAQGTTGYVLQEAVRGGAGAPLYRASLLVKP